MPDPESNAELVEDRVVSLVHVGQRSTRPAGRWVLLAGGLVVALGAAVLSARLTNPPLAAVASPSPSASQSAPPPLVAATLPPPPTADVGPCGTGSVQFQVNAQPVPGHGLEQIKVPSGGMIALAIADSPTSGSLVLAKAHAGDPGTTDAGVIATFTGSDIEPGAVTPIGWSAAGDALLVSAGHRSTSSADDNCSDLYLLQTLGAEVELSSLTDDGVGGRAESGALSQDGGRVAYAQARELRLVDVHGPRPGTALHDCDRPQGAARWSPDDTSILAICNNQIVIADLANDESRSFAAAPNTILMTAGWTPDGKSIVTVAARTGQMVFSPLGIAEIDAVTGGRTERPVSPTNTQWVVGTSTMSPDGRWALVQGNDTYALDIATGTATNLPWIVLSASFDPVTIAWLADGNSVLYADSGALYEVDLAAITRTAVGAIPASNFAWYQSPP